MEREVDMVVQHAVDVAQARGARLVAVSVKGGATTAEHEAIRGLVVQAFVKRGLPDAEVRIEAGTGPLRLTTVELSAAG